MRTFILILILNISFIYSDIRSNTGTIKFKPNLNSSEVMTLTESGLGIGVNPSSNLHVSGNIVTTGEMTLGEGSTQNSTLNINGSLALSVESVSSNITLSSNTLVSADSSMGDIVITLPSATQAIGRTYIIKKIKSAGNVFITGNVIDDEHILFLEAGKKGSLQVCSMGVDQWSVLNISGNGELWAPSQLTTLSWFDAADSDSIIEDSGTISQWNDKSSNSNHASQGTSGSQASYDSANVEVDFDGNDIYTITNDPFNGIDNPCIIGLIRLDSSSNWSNSVASFFGEAGEGWQFRQRSSNINDYTLTIRGTAEGDDPNPTDTINTSDFIATGYRKNADTRIVRHNGTQTSILNGTDTGSVNYAGNGTSAIGGRYRGAGSTTPQGYFNGSIKELIVADGLSDAEVEILEGYMAWKWGLQSNLASGHAYEHAPPTLP